ncbi:MAG: DUF1214 domain-containing protein [Pseudorhodoplanes sp.]
MKARLSRLPAVRPAALALSMLAALAVAAPARAQQTTRLTDADIVEAYEYMLGRWLVLRQEALDLKEGFKWNELVHRAPEGPASSNPDVVYSEGWIALDEKTCTLVDIPEIKGRYYSLQVLNGWGEVTANVNERTFPKHPFGRFALCLRDAKANLPKGTQRVNLPSKKSRVVMRIELGANPDEAIALQKKIAMKATGAPKIDEAVVKPDFPNSRLPGAEGFERAEEILASEPDINAGMLDVRDKARAVARAVADPAQRARVDEIIRKRAIPVFLSEIPKVGRPVNGWIHPRNIGNYRTDYLMRTIANYQGGWANSSREAVYFTMSGIEGGQMFTQTYPADALPASKARYFWSVIALDNERQQPVSNSLSRSMFNTRSPLKFNADGSLTLGFGPRLPANVPESNWIPTQNGRRYTLTYRFYGPSKDASDGKYYPPALMRQR